MRRHRRKDRLFRYTCQAGIGGKVQGEALAAGDNFSARCDLDRIPGVFSRPQLKLIGRSCRDRIRVVNTAKGGVASVWILHEMKVRGAVPKAILFNTREHHSRARRRARGPAAVRPLGRR